MKLVFDPFQAIAAGATGMVARGLLAGTAIIVGGGLATRSGAYMTNDNAYVANAMLTMFLLPAALITVATLGGFLASLCLSTAWITFGAYLRFNTGKWILFTLFASTLYGGIFFDLNGLYGGLASDDSPFWRWWAVHRWPLVSPVIAGMILAIPDLLNFQRRAAARSAESNQG